MKGFRAPGLILAAVLLFSPSLPAQQWLQQDDGSRTNRSIFREIDSWPQPNDLRNASGAPGPRYWQQRVDYDIDARLDTTSHRVIGTERITYHNNSPDVLLFVWIQLDQNVESSEHSRSRRSRGALPERISPAARQFLGLDPFEGGHTVSRVQVVDASGKRVDAGYRINDTIMKVNLDRPLRPGGQAAIEIDWSFPVPDRGGSRGAKEKVPSGWLYNIAQWFPRMSVYDDVNGWQTDQFLGRGEFYLNFGDYDVRLTVPANHIVDATGVLQNPEEVLTAEQRRRLAEAYKSTEPRFIIGPDEAGKPEVRPASQGMLTWHFKAENVRDFAWVASRAYVWDAAGFTYRDGETPIAVHSLYPPEAMPLWDKVSTRATIQTLETYGRMSLEYPYPKAVNVNGPVGGMEYPMVAFCGARPRPDGTYSEALERGLISVTIHEVGHNWFPMIIASDERKWTWMDEGVNTFVQYYAEQDYARRYTGTEIGAQFVDGVYGSRRGPASTIVDYMRDPDQVPIMTHSDLIHKDFGNNGYAKPASGLFILREHILGPDVFDEAFRAYSNNWAFKHPQPADFYRSIEENAGEDLAYFWRGWFYTTHANDQAVASVRSQPAAEIVGDESRGKFYYRIEVHNVGGLVMPIHMEVRYEDGSTEFIALPADAWRNNEKSFTKGLFAKQPIVRVELDPREAFADIDRSNNVWEHIKLDQTEVGG